MNRKLHNSMLAFSATGLMLAFALLAASPMHAGHSLRAPVAAAAAVVTVDAAAVQARTRAAKAAEVRASEIEASARELEARLEASDSLDETIAGALDFAAAVSTRAVLDAALDAADGDADDERREQASERRRHARQVRGALAVPYFSFAQGLRRAGRS